MVTMARSFSFLLALACLWTAQAAQVSHSTSDKGSAVVERVVQLIQGSCIFDDDKLFLRRLAYVESGDGKHPKTYRPDYHGGIWQVDKNMYDATIRKADANILNEVKGKLGIDWKATKWEDLRDPVHSGLGARIYMSTLGVANIPRPIPDQGNYWKTHFRPSESAQTYITAANTLEKGCTGNKGSDIVFLLDTSGSVKAHNFEKMKTFAQDVVRAFDVGPGLNQFGVMSFNSMVYRDFLIGTHKTKNEVLNRIGQIPWRQGGTRTDLALEDLIATYFREGNGARKKSESHPRIAIVLTDGQSNKPDLTKVAAKKVHDQDLTVFAIGVGSNVFMEELLAIASDPYCLHLFLLEGFDEIESLKYAIQQRTCDAPIIIGPGDDSSDTLEPDESVNCKLRVGKDGVTVKLNTEKGSSTFYVAYDNYPSDLYYDIKEESEPGKPGVVFIKKPSGVNDEEAILFCSIQGDPTEDSEVEIGVDDGDTDRCKNHQCKNNGFCVDMGDYYICECPPGYEGKYCETDIDECASNPCQNGGQCIDGVDKYTCSCKPGYEGKNCEIKTTQCEPNPCKNGGTCIDTADGYRCQCRDGYSGINCQNCKELIVVTPNDYTFGHVVVKPKQQEFLFRVKACYDAHVALATDTLLTNNPYYEVVFGINYNSEARIYKKPQNAHLVMKKTGQLLNCYEFRSLWITWKYGVIRGGTGSVPGQNTVIVYDDPHPLDVKFISVTTWTTDPATWAINRCDDVWVHLDAQATKVERFLEEEMELDEVDSLYAKTKDMSYREVPEQLPEPDIKPGQPNPDTYDCESRNPCKTAGSTTGYYFPHDIAEKFVQCSEHGKCFVMNCKNQMKWNQKIMQCLPPNVEGK